MLTGLERKELRKQMARKTSSGDLMQDHSLIKKVLLGEETPVPAKKKQMSTDNIYSWPTDEPKLEQTDANVVVPNSNCFSFNSGFRYGEKGLNSLAAHVSEHHMKHCSSGHAHKKSEHKETTEQRHVIKLRNGCLLDLSDKEQPILNPTTLNLNDRDVKRHKHLFKLMQSYYEWIKVKFLAKPMAASCFYFPYRR